MGSDTPAVHIAVCIYIYIFVIKKKFIFLKGAISLLP